MPDPHLALTPFHITVQVRDSAEARDFYGDILGCAEGRSDGDALEFEAFQDIETQLLATAPAAG